MDSAEPLPWEQTHQPIPMVAQRGRRISSDNLNSDGWRAHYPRLSAPIAVWQRKLLEQQFQRQHVAIIVNQLGWLGSRCSVSTGPSIIKDLQTQPIILQFILESAVVQFLLFYEEMKLFILSLWGRWSGIWVQIFLLFSFDGLGIVFSPLLKSPAKSTKLISATDSRWHLIRTFCLNILYFQVLSHPVCNSLFFFFFFICPLLKAFFYRQIQIGRCLLFMSKNEVPTCGSYSEITTQT